MMNTTTDTLRRRLLASAAQFGFIACGVAAAAPIAPWRARTVRRWLDAGRAAGMDYLHRHYAMRCDPRLLVPEVRTIVTVAMPYDAAPPFADGAMRLARYALGDDYHDVVRDGLRRWLQAMGFDPQRDGRVFCDTAPVDERYWAWRSGMGRWLRSGMIAVPGHGTYVVLGEWFAPYDAAELLARLPDCDADFAMNPSEIAVSVPDADAAFALPDACLQCGRCVDACPAGALGDGGFDARRCLSYLTIEHRGPLPDDVDSRMGRMIYGCDRCAEVCPHNAHPLPADVIPPALRPREKLLDRSLTDWRRLTVEDYRRLFRGSAVKRAKYEGLLRNIHAHENG